MKTNIAENIRRFRKERKLTQEQLSEALGVTVGAVSKWESGASMPDISLIMDMADFFETSIDILLGYNLQSGGISKAVERIKQFRNEKRFADASAECEKALQKYPNSFEVVFSCAIQYSLRGVEQQSEKSFIRALTLFERSLELIDQNTNVKISEWTIKNNIAHVYLSLKQPDKALESMKNNNADGLNDGYIGYVLASIKQESNEALPYLSSALVSAVTEIFRITNGYINAYCNKKDYATALEMSQFMHSILVGLMRKNAVSYINKLDIQVLCESTIMADLCGNLDAAKNSLQLALDEAKRFDSTPSYDFTSMKYFFGDEKPTGFDDFGNTALEGIKNMLAANEDCDTELLAMITE